MEAVKPAAPEGRGAQAPGLRGGYACRARRNAGTAGRLRLWTGAKRQVGAPSRPKSPAVLLRSAALELSAACVRAGFPPAPRRGRV